MLRSFSILIAMGYNNEFSLVSKQEVIKACSHLDSLKFIDITHTSPFSFQTDSETAIAVVKSMNDSQDMKIKKLDIRLSSKYEEACILIPLLNICRELRSLTLNSDFQPNTVANIARIFKSGSYINLDELHLRVIREVDQDDIRLPTILDAFNEAFVGKTYMIGLGHGLHSLSLGNKMEIHRPLIQCITKFQLTRLELLDTTRISIPLFSEVMHSLPNLISVQAAIHTKYHAQVGFHADEDIYKEWMCVGLAELKILIERSYVKRTISGKPIESPNTFLFDQIGRLEHLTDFDITTRYQDILSLKSGPGHLRQLSGLKQLRSIKITSSECHLGAEEAQWMIDNWPKLTFIEGKTCRLGEPFKSKLLKARAHLIAI
ncbi:hypothetical protein BGZ76_004440 [Entomortierella beljakovae]|nr:hypothetical protein BGZ76_004440 [Entomortierella beljakovae]